MFFFLNYSLLLMQNFRLHLHHQACYLWEQDTPDLNISNRIWPSLEPMYLQSINARVILNKRFRTDVFRSFSFFLCSW